MASGAGGGGGGAAGSGRAGNNDEKVNYTNSQIILRNTAARALVTVINDEKKNKNKHPGRLRGEANERLIYNRHIAEVAAINAGVRKNNIHKKATEILSTLDRSNEARAVSVPLPAGDVAGGGWFTPGEDRNTLKNRFSVGEIPDDVQEVESIGEAYHDFSTAGGRAKGAIIKDKIVFINDLMGIPFSTNEEKTAEYIHNAFNGSDKRGIFRLDKNTTYRTYEDPADLERDLFTDDNVHPLLFMLKPEHLRGGRFNGVFDRLKDILRRKYHLQGLSDRRLCVSDDSYDHHTDGNPINLNRMLSAASFFDPATTGVSEAGVRAAKAEGRFIENVEVSGQSIWGNYFFKSNTVGGNYSGATLILDIKGYLDRITLNIPANLRHGLSVYDLSVIYDRIKSVKGKIDTGERTQIIKDLLVNLRTRHPNRIGDNIDRFFTQIIEYTIQLYNASDKAIPTLLLEFIFLLKELGDMLTHKVAVKYGHLAGASPDRLSTIGFSKRGTPLTYMRVSPGKLPRILFRVLGTFHIKGDGMSNIAFIKQNQDAKDKADALELERKTSKERKEADAKARALERTARLEYEKAEAKREVDERTRRTAEERRQRANRGRGGAANVNMSERAKRQRAAAAANARAARDAAGGGGAARGEGAVRDAAGGGGAARGEGAARDAGGGGEAAGGEGEAAGGEGGVSKVPVNGSSPKASGRGRLRSDSNTSNHDRRSPTVRIAFPGGVIQGVRNLRKLRNSRYKNFNVNNTENENGNENGNDNMNSENENVNDNMNSDNDIFRSINNKSQRKKKQRGGYRNKTFKQRGGALTEERIDELINSKIKSVIDSVFNNLNRVLTGPPDESTALLKVVAVDEEINLDLIENGLFVDNEFLGLPLATILNELYDNLYELPQEDYENEVLLEVSMNIIIKDFLIGYNFGESDIVSIMRELEPAAAAAATAAATGVSSGHNTPMSASTTTNPATAITSPEANPPGRPVLNPSGIVGRRLILESNSDGSVGAASGAAPLQNTMSLRAEMYDSNGPVHTRKASNLYYRKTPRKSRKNSTLKKRRI